MRNIVQALERIGAGDLHARIGTTTTRRDPQQLAVIARSIDASTASMGHLIGELRQQSREVEGTATALSRVSAPSPTTPPPSNAATAMAAGVEELAVSINILSDNARSTDASVRETRELAARAATLRRRGQPDGLHRAGGGRRREPDRTPGRGLTTDPRWSR